MKDTLVEFDLASIKPSRGPQFSPSLYRWMRKQSPHVRDGMKLYRGYGPMGGKNQKKDWLYIGSIQPDGWFNGTRLYSILCFGSSKIIYAYMPSHVRSLGLVEIKDFWPRYSKIGRCAIDVEHTHYFQGDETRWRVNGNARHCVWCDAVSQKKKAWTETRIVKHEKWILA